jgi:hypothetical protein
MRDHGPDMTLGDMRRQGIRWVDMNCHCGHAETLPADEFPDRLIVSGLREQLRCPRCGARPRQTRPHSGRGPLRRPSSQPSER